MYAFITPRVKCNGNFSQSTLVLAGFELPNEAQLHVDRLYFAPIMKALS